jgi:hypothetical protein
VEGESHTRSHRCGCVADWLWRLATKEFSHGIIKLQPAVMTGGLQGGTALTLDAPMPSSLDSPLTALWCCSAVLRRSGALRGILLLPSLVSVGRYSQRCDLIDVSANGGQLGDAAY